MERKFDADTTRLAEEEPVLSIGHCSPDPFDLKDFLRGVAILIGGIWAMVGLDWIVCAIWKQWLRQGLPL